MQRDGAIRKRKACAQEQSQAFKYSKCTVPLLPLRNLNAALLALAGIAPTQSFCDLGHGALPNVAAGSGTRPTSMQ
eukprot:1154339-Pelagomonas_calceolata.AAC.3